MSTFATEEAAEILADALVIDMHLIEIQKHMAASGTVIPMRTLGHWEEMRLEQRDILFREMKEAREIATYWNWDYCDA